MEKDGGSLNVAKKVRELEALDKLERRVRELVSPDPKLLAQIAAKRAELLKA